MNHGSACKVDRFDRCAGVPNSVHQTVDAPNHMSEREVDDEHPRADKKKQGGEFNSFRDRPDDQCGSDDGKHHLVHAENILGNPVGVIGVRSRCHSL